MGIIFPGESRKKKTGHTMAMKIMTRALKECLSVYPARELTHPLRRRKWNHPIPLMLSPVLMTEEVRQSCDVLRGAEGTLTYPLT
jgi:hypothetical protein